jgi:hypothetical protein
MADRIEVDRDLLQACLDAIEVRCDRCGKPATVQVLWSDRDPFSCNDCLESWKTAAATDGPGDRTDNPRIRLVYKSEVCEKLRAALSVKPRFEHDCTKCIFTGQDEEFDFYYCPPFQGTVVARYSDDGPDYTSQPVSCVQQTLERGLDDLDGKHYEPTHESVQRMGTVRALKAARAKGVIP